MIESFSHGSFENIKHQYPVVYSLNHENLTGGKGGLPRSMFVKFDVRDLRQTLPWVVFRRHTSRRLGWTGKIHPLLLRTKVCKTSDNFVGGIGGANENVVRCEEAA